MSAQTGEEAMVEHIAECRPDITAAIVMQRGSADDVVANLIAQGWTEAAEPEIVAGKRLRTLAPPPGWVPANA